MIKPYPQSVTHLAVKYEENDLVFYPYEKPEKATVGELRWYNTEGTYTLVSGVPGSVILFGDYGSISNIKNLNNDTICSGVFRYKTNFTVPLGINFQNCTYAGYLFANCDTVTFGLSDMMPNVTDTSYMFYAAKNITVPRITSEKLTTTSYMFQSAQNITIRPGTHWENVKTAAYMFASSKNITLPAGMVFKPAGSSYIFQNATIAFPPDFEFDPTGNCEWLFCDSTRVTAWPDSFKLARLNSAYTLFHNNTANLIAGIPDTITLESATSFSHTFNNCRPYDPETKKYQRIQKLPRDLNMRNASDCNNFTASGALGIEALTQIADTIKTWTSGTHNITLGILNTLQNTTEVNDLLARIRAKGWSVTAQYNALV